MNRRNLFGCAVGAFAFLFGRRKAKAEKLCEHIYDWQESYTNDRRCRPLGFGSDSPLIFCDDRLVVSQDVSYCQSGERGYYTTVVVGKNGWFEQMIHHGRIIVEPSHHEDRNLPTKSARSGQEVI